MGGRGEEARDGFEGGDEGWGTAHLNDRDLFQGLQKGYTNDVLR